MSLRPPSRLSGNPASDVYFDALDHEVLAEKASALGRVGAKAEALLARLEADGRKDGDGEARLKLVGEVAEAVYAWFIQRELCGLRRHDQLIRDFRIPREVLIRLGAK